MIYFTADLHFYHRNIIKFCNRPWENEIDMNETLIEKWNSIIKYNDEVYILGDFLMALEDSGIKANEILKRLKGKKYMIIGNHDKFLKDRNFDPKYFEWIKDIYTLKWEKQKYILFHYPMLEWSGYYGNAIHLYGHVHNSALKNKEVRKRFEVLGNNAINVGIDVWDYKPVSIEQIKLLPRDNNSDKHVE